MSKTSVYTGILVKLDMNNLSSKAHHHNLKAQRVGLGLERFKISANCFFFLAGCGSSS